jgi:hypothetical protein
MQRLSTLILFAALVTPAQAGTISISPATSTVVLGQTLDQMQPAIIVVSINSTNPMPPAGPDHLRAVETFLTISGPGTGVAGPFELGLSLPSGSSIENGGGSGGVNLIPGANSLSSFSGVLYQFELRVTAPGMYTIMGSTDPVESAAVYGLGTGREDDPSPSTVDNLAPANFATVEVLPFPEPGSLMLAGVCLGGLALRAWRRVAR